MIPPHGAAGPRRFLRAVVVFTGVIFLALSSAGAAQAEVLAYLEPGFTKTTTNSWFFSYTRVQGTTSDYFICFRLRKDGIVIENHNGGTDGPGSLNCTGNIYANGAEPGWV